MKKLFLFAALFVAAAFSSCSKHDDVETPDLPEPQPLAIAFAEGNSLEFNGNETKTIHYTITSSSNKIVVKAVMQTSDGAYTLSTASTSATEGTIKITAKTPTDNRVLVTVSNGLQIVTTVITVSAKSSSQKLAIAFAEGKSLQFDVDETKTVHYTITGGSDKTVVKAKMQKSDNAYTLSMASTSATQGTITITAKKPETDNCVVVTVSDGSQTVTAEIAVSTNAIPEKDKLAITFAEGNSLQFNAGETKTVHYTITGGGANTVVNVKMQKSDGAYALSTTLTSATQGTITITAKTPETENHIIVTVSDGSQSITAEIAVSTSSKITVTVETPGTLSQLLAGYDKTKITELIVIGNLNSPDISTLNNLPNLAVLDIDNVNLEELPAEALKDKTSLISVKLPKILKIIGNGAFSGCSSLTSITIPDSVTEIGNSAFQSCSSLTTFYGKFASSDNRCLIVDDKLTAFAPAGLTFYTIPDSVTEIGNNAFEYCSRLTRVTIPDSVMSIGDKAFSNCSGLTNVRIGSGVKSIGEFAFQLCSGLTSITIPNSVISIGYGAFEYCSGLISMTIPDSVTSIGDKVFSNCSGLTSVRVGSGVKSIREYAFEYCSRLTSVTIPDNVTEIGDYAFYKCSGLTKVRIGSGVKSIGKCAFRFCDSLKSITIPDSVTEIGESAFPNLTSVTIGRGVRSIGRWAFWSSSLQVIYCKAIVPPAGTDVFYNFSAVLYVPTGSKTAYVTARGWDFTTIIETKF